MSEDYVPPDWMVKEIQQYANESEKRVCDACNHIFWVKPCNKDTCCESCRRGAKRRHPGIDTSDGFRITWDKIAALQDGLNRLDTHLLDLQAAVLPLIREILEHIRPEQPSTPNLLTIKEACAFLRVCGRTLNRLIQMGQLRRVRIGKKVLFKRRELENYIDRKNKPYSPRRG